MCVRATYERGRRQNEQTLAQKMGSKQLQIIRKFDNKTFAALLTWFHRDMENILLRSFLLLVPAHTTHVFLPCWKHLFS